MELEKYVKQIEKTGFVLEARIAEMLRRHRWTVIHGRYYIDDIQDSVREIDLLAYKVKKINGLLYYTTLIVSCKKSEQNIWALLTKNRDNDDPNMDWDPLQVWSNSEVLSFMLSRDWEQDYLEKLEEIGIYSVLMNAEVNLFAFQEMNRSKGTPQNDKALFSATTSLMKAQNYEIKALPERKQTPALYQFNLVSVFDGDLVRLHFSDGQVTASERDSDVYIGNYIVDQSDTCSRIHLVRANAFDTFLDSYDELYQFNCRYFPDLRNSFYDSAVSDFQRRKLLEEDFLSQIKWRVEVALERDVPYMFLSYHAETDTLRVEINVQPQELDLLNEKEDLLALLRKTAKSVYRFSGDVRFSEYDDDLPF